MLLEGKKDNMWFGEMLWLLADCLPSLITLIPVRLMNPVWRFMKKIHTYNCFNQETMISSPLLPR